MAKILGVLILSFCLTTFAFAQTADNWADYIGNEYETVPNITYRTANNADLKLNLYVPRNRQQPKPIVIFIHGGGWVEGKKEYDSLHLLPYLAMGFSAVKI